MLHETEDISTEEASIGMCGSAGRGGTRVPLISHEISWPFTTLDAVTIEDHPVPMEVDTGAALSLASEATFKELWPDRCQATANIRLCSYSGEAIPVLIS